jgi:carbon-monoxide dehydrogenase large subunit
MNLQSDPNDFTVMKFGIGQPVRRTEDPILVRGEGRYTDDISLPGQAHAVIVRSKHAHGVIKSIDKSAALKMPGVLGIYTGADFAAYGTLKCIVPANNRDGTPMLKPARHALATGKVRFVGDPVACVAAETLYQAKDAAEALQIDIEPLPVNVDLAAADAPNSPILYDDVPRNVPLDFHFGDAAATAEAFKRAAHVTKLDMVNSRLVVNSMEPRGAIAEYDKTSGRYTLHTGCQGVVGIKGTLAQILNVEPAKVRVLTGNVGGSFGMKGAVYPEYVCVAHAAKALGRPVKWIDERSSAFVSDNHGRDNLVHGELALDADGKILALRLSVHGNMGGYLGAMAPQMSTFNTVKNVASVYRTPLIEVSTRCVFTNTTFVSPYRGAGRPEGNYYMERLLDAAAADMGIDRIELRRRNQIRPRELPFKSAVATTYDSGDFPAVLKQALEAADFRGFNKRKRESRRRGRLRGIGVGCFLEVTAPPSKEMGGIRFEADGTVTIITGTLDYGQGHAAPFAQVLTEKLGVPFERIRLLQGDSDELLAGGGTGGSKSIMHSGTAIVDAAAKVVEQGKQIASHVLEAAVSDIEFKNGRFVIAGTDRSIGIMELADKLRSGLNLPDGAPKSLSVSMVSDGPGAATYPNGCHVAEVEVDPDTGVTEMVKYTCVNDFGVVVNPMIVDGQVHGGVAQGIGQALMEMTVYDDDGQLLTGSFMDYAMPRAQDLPMFAVESHPVPAKTNVLGVKGCAEAGCAGGLASAMNAVVDALSEYGIRHIDMPATPHRVWQAIQTAKAGSA